jgi:hypothetical protein
MPEHIVEQGEHIATIALKHGFADHMVIWDDPKNAALRKERQNPFVLLPGDAVFVPDRLEKQEPASTAQTNRFKVRMPRIKLRLALLGLDGEPMAGTACTVNVDGKAHDLTTGGDGIVEVDVSRSATEGTLAIPSIELKTPLKIGSLDPVDVISGQWGRLNNLGYNAGSKDDPEDPAFKSAVEEFQCDNELTVDGACGPGTRSKLVEIYGC